MTGETVSSAARGAPTPACTPTARSPASRSRARIPERGLLRGLNSILPPDIAILEVREAPPEFDARFSARGKVYRYRIWNHLVRSPLHARASWHVPLGAGHGGDARGRAPRWSASTTSAPSAPPTASGAPRVRVVRRLDVDRQGALLTFEVEATAFLKNMVRILVGTLVDVGRGQLPPDAIARMLRDRRPRRRRHDRAAAGPDAAARDLLDRRSIAGDAAPAALHLGDLRAHPLEQRASRSSSVRPAVGIGRADLDVDAARADEQAPARHDLARAADRARARSSRPRRSPGESPPS